MASAAGSMAFDDGSGYTGPGKYALMMGLTGFSTVMLWNATRRLPLSAAPWNHVLFGGVMAGLGYEVGQAGSDMGGWLGAQRQALTRLPSWAVGLAENQGWATDGMQHMKAVQDLRRQVIVQDEAAFRADAAAHQRAVVEDGAQGAFQSSVAPLTLPPAFQQDVASFLASLRAELGAGDAFDSAVARFKERLSAAAGPQFKAGETEDGKALLAGIRTALACKLYLQHVLAESNMEEGRAVLGASAGANEAAAAAIWRERRDALAFAVSVAQQQAVHGIPGSDGVQYVQMPAIVQLVAGGAVPSALWEYVPPTLFTEPVATDVALTPQLESMLGELRAAVEGAEQGASAHGAGPALSDEEVTAGLEALVLAAKEEIAVRLGWCQSVDMLSTVAAELAEAGEEEAAKAVSTAAQHRSEAVSSLVSSDGLSLTKAAESAPASLVVEAWHSTLAAQVDRQHLAAVMVECGWDPATAVATPSARHEARARALAALRAEVDQEALGARVAAAVAKVSAEEVVPAIASSMPFPGVSQEALQVLARNEVVASALSAAVTADVSSALGSQGPHHSMASVLSAVRTAFEQR